MIGKSPAINVATAEIPNHLIYEMHLGKPIFFQGYEDVLSGIKSIEQITSRNMLQAWIKTKIALTSFQILEGLGYEVFTGKLGIYFNQDNWRVSDISIFRASTLELTNQYAKTAPEIAIEIDVQADTQALGGDMKYITEKTNQYLSNGVKKVIWIFTNASGLMEATEVDNFKISSWDKDLEIMEGIVINISQLLENRNKTTA